MQATGRNDVVAVLAATVITQEGTDVRWRINVVVLERNDARNHERVCISVGIGAKLHVCVVAYTQQGY